MGFHDIKEAARYCLPSLSSVARTKSAPPGARRQLAADGSGLAQEVVVDPRPLPQVHQGRKVIAYYRSLQYSQTRWACTDFTIWHKTA